MPLALHLVSAMTDYERARLRLDAWIAISGWGAAMAVGDDAPDWLKFNPPIKSWDWETRKAKANDLYLWLITSALESDAP